MRRLAPIVALGLAGCSLTLDPSAFLARDGSNGGMDSGVDAGIDAQVRPCTCPDDADVCTRDDRGDPVCSRPDVTCDACPAGYACGAGTTCECTDSSVCGAECASDADCGTRRCDPVRRVCRPQLGCLNYLACDELCIDLRCSGGGSVPAGGACARSEDCLDGPCRDGFCESTCLYNDDCGSGRTCAFLPGSYTSTCVPTPAACTACTDIDSTCSSTGECHTGCEEQFDCDDGSQCVLSSSGYGCRPSALLCGEGEVVIESANACALPLGCYTSDDPACPAGFECRSEESLGLGNSRETGFCVSSSG